jgi:hypothetical protein
MFLRSKTGLLEGVRKPVQRQEPVSISISVATWARGKFYVTLVKGECNDINAKISVSKSTVSKMREF